MLSARVRPDARPENRCVIKADWLLVLLTMGAVVRLTRMVVEDVVLQPARSFIVRHREKPGPASSGPLIANAVPPQDAPPKDDWLVYLVHCRWCVSIWVSAAVTPVVYNWPTAWWVQIPLLALTASLLAGLSGRWE